MDEGRLATSAQPEEQNLAAAIFQIEQRDVDQVLPFASAVMTWLADPDQELIRRDLATWMERVVLEPQRLARLNLSGKLSPADEPAMLADKARAWRESLIAEGKAEGIVDSVRQMVSDGFLTVDQARAQVHKLIYSGHITAAQGRETLNQLG